MQTLIEGGLIVNGGGLIVFQEKSSHSIHQFL